MANGNGDAVKITRATLALIIAISAPVATGAVAEYRSRQTEARSVENSERIRRLEIMLTRMESNADAIKEQSEEIKDLRSDIQALTAQVNRRLR